MNSFGETPKSLYDGGLKEIPAIIIEVNEDDLAIMALIENLQREDLVWKKQKGIKI